MFSSNKKNSKYVKPLVVRSLLCPSTRRSRRSRPASPHCPPLQQAYQVPNICICVHCICIWLSTLRSSSATNFPGSQNAAPAPNAPVQPAFSSQNRWKHEIYIWHSLWRAVTNSTITFVFSFQSGHSLAGQGFAGAALWLSRTRLRKIEPLQTRSLWIWSSCRKNRPGGAKRAGASSAKG